MFLPKLEASKQDKRLKITAANQCFSEQTIFKIKQKGRVLKFSCTYFGCF